MYGLHISNHTWGGVSVLQHQVEDDEHWDLEGANTAYGEALRKAVPDLDWDQLTYITATAEAKERLKQDSENYRQQKEEQREQERQEKERQRQQQKELEEPPINLAGLEALKRGFGLRGGHASHLLAPSASRKTSAVQGVTNARMAADSVVAATLLVEEKDLEAVTGEILARVRAQDAAEAELLPPLPEEDAEKPPEQEEVKYKYHYGHSVGMKPGEMDQPGHYGPDPELVEAAEARRQRSNSRRRLPRARSSSRGRGLVSLYVEGEEEKEEEVDKVPTKSRCPWGHGLERWTCRAEGMKCEDCGPYPFPKHSVFFGCRNCDWHLCSLHGSAAEPEVKLKAEKAQGAESAKAGAAEPPPSPETVAESSGDAAPAAAAGEAAASEAAAAAVDPEEEEEQRRRARRAPKPEPEPERGRSERRLSYKERMKQRLEGTAKRLEEGKDIRRYEWAETGERASARDAQGILDQAKQEQEAEMEALRPPSPRLELPEDFCPLCHQIATGAKKPLTKGGHTFKAGCRRAKGA